MAGPHPEERIARPIVCQDWRDVAFLHWRMDPEALRPHLPRRLAPDLVDGSAWITLTPFRVERFRALGLAPMPFRPSFEETNLRTYVRDERGCDGLWFFSLDVSNAANAVAGRAIVPYFFARMS